MADDLDTAGAVASYLGAQTLPQQARTGVAAGLAANPDTEARLRDIAKLTGLPVDSVRADPDRLAAQATVQTTDFDGLAQKFPSTAAFLGSVPNAQVAHDDTENLGLIETTINSFKRGVPGLQQNLSATALRANAGILANVQTIEQKLAAGQPVLDSEDPYAIRLMSPEQRAAFKAQAVQAAGGNAQNIAAKQAEKAALPQPDVVARVMNAKGWGDAFSAFFSDPIKFIASIGPESMIQSAPGMVGAVPATILGGPAAGAAVLGAGSFTTDYGSSILEAMGKEGVNLSDPAAITKAAQDPALMQRVAAQAMAHASVVGAVDAASGGLASKIALPGRVVTKLAGKPVARELANMGVQMPTQGIFGAAGEAGGEIAAGQPLDPGNIIAEFAGEFAGAPAEVATMAAGRVKERLAEAQQATQNAAAFQQLNDLAAASKVKARAADTFEEFIAGATQDGPVQDVYISAAALAQSGVAEQVAAVSPSAAAQMPVALETGADIRIPISEYATAVAGQDFAQGLVEHLKTDPEGFSQAEATEYIAQHGETLRQEVETALNAQAGDDTFKRSRDAVQEDIAAQLASANRFTPDVNAPYAALVANFYAVQAARVGTTPDELFQQYPLRVVAQKVGGLEQAAQTQRVAETARIAGDLRKRSSVLKSLLECMG